MENSEESGAGQKFLGKPLIVSAIFAVAFLLLDSTGTFDDGFGSSKYDTSRLEHRSVFDHIYLSQTEKNVSAGFRGLLNEYPRMLCTEIKFEKIEDSFDLMQNPPRRPSSRVTERRKFIVFNLKCSDSNGQQKIYPIPIENTDVSHMRVGILKLNLPDEPIKYDEENVKRDNSHIAKSFLIGKLYIDLGDESVRRELINPSDPYFQSDNIWKNFYDAGEINFALIYKEGGFITRSLIKIWHISIIILSSLLALRIGLAVLMGAGAKKDARFKTGYKDNVSTGSRVSIGLEMTRWAAPYMVVNFKLSFFVFLYLFAVPSSWTFENFVGMLFMYGFLVGMSWGVMAMAVVYPLRLFLFGG